MSNTEVIQANGFKIHYDYVNNMTAFSLEWSPLGYALRGDHREEMKSFGSYEECMYYFNNNIHLAVIDTEAL